MSDMEGFWDAQHRGAVTYWLTATEVGHLLSLYELDKPVGMRITEIGIGIGAITRSLSVLNPVCAVDISREALRGVEAFAQTLHISELHRAPSADLAIVHLVLQHCDKQMVEHILSVPMVPGGTLAVQTAYPLAPIKGEVMKESVALGRIVWHTRDEMAEVLRRKGFIIKWERTQDYAFNGDSIGWTLFKCEKGRG